MQPNKMDAVDTQQQREIDDLKEVNFRQDSHLTNIIWAFALFALLQFGSMVIFFSEFGTECPHRECPHHATVATNG